METNGVISRITEPTPRCAGMVVIILVIVRTVLFSYCKYNYVIVCVPCSCMHVCSLLYERLLELNEILLWRRGLNLLVFYFVF